MFKTLKLRPKLLLVGILLTLVPLVLFGIFVLIQNRSTLNVSIEESKKLAKTDLEPRPIGRRRLNRLNPPQLAEPRS